MKGYMKSVAGVLGLVIGLGIILGFSHPVRADTLAADWLQQPMTLTKIDDITPVEMNGSSAGNVPCDIQPVIYRAVNTSSWNSAVMDGQYQGCFTSSAIGDIDTSGAVRDYGAKYSVFLSNSDTNYKLGDYNALLPVAHTNRLVVMPRSSHALMIADDFRQTFANIQKDYRGNVYRLQDKPYDFTLKNSDGSLSSIRQDSVAFSANGRWMTASVNGQSMVRINLDSDQYSVLPFASAEQSGFGTPITISNDGQFVAVFRPYDGLYVYDLGQCSGDRGWLVSRECQFTKLASSDIRSKVGLGSVAFSGLRFTTATTLVANIAGQQGRDWLYGRWEITVPSITPPERYLALGDSFSSGEGAGDYYDATNFYVDASNYNKCHQSKRSYSELLATQLTPSWYDSIACSGAVMKDVEYGSPKGDVGYIQSDDKQASSILSEDNIINNAKSSILPGYIPQLSVLKANPSTVSTLTIGGNDIGFGDIVTACVLEAHCYANRDNREYVADMIASKIPMLTQTYTAIKQNMSGPNPRLYVVGYPHLLNQDTACNGFMGVDERHFANSLVDYLNASIRIATQRAGVYYVDVSGAFVTEDGADHRLCGNASQAANGMIIDIANMSDEQPFDKYISSSFHPNATGHALLAATIRAQTDDFAQTMPAVKTDGLSRPDEGLYLQLVGDANNTLDDTTDFEIVKGLTTTKPLTTNSTFDVVLNLSQSLSLPALNGLMTVQFHSDAVDIGTLSLQPDGTATGTFSVPAGTNPGVHSVHVLYTDINGQKHDVMQYVLVVSSQTDFDGDGVINTLETCVYGKVFGIDTDKDGVDDACDGDIRESPPTTDTSHTDPTSSTDTSHDTSGSTTNSNQTTQSSTATIPNHSSIPQTGNQTTDVTTNTSITPSIKDPMSSGSVLSAVTQNTALPIIMRDSGSSLGPSPLLDVSTTTVNWLFASANPSETFDTIPNSSPPTLHMTASVNPTVTTPSTALQINQSTQESSVFLPVTIVICGGITLLSLLYYRKRISKRKAE